MNTPAPPPADAAPGATRRRKLTILAVCVLAGGISWAAYWYAYARWRVSTDDAYVAGTVILVTAEVPGSIRAVYPRETEAVVAGQTLMTLDPADARIAMDAAVADLGNTARQVKGAYAQVDRLKAQVTARSVELARAQADLKRRFSIADGGAVSAEDVAHAQDNVAALDASLRATREELNVALAQTSGTTPAEHPQVLRAAARVREAALALRRTVIKAPLDGVIAKKGAQVGQRVSPGMPLMGLVPLEDVWVDANFKEVQLDDLRIGQPVTLRADQYGRSVDFTGRVEGFSPGTGAAFALLPAQNASGNWIKIVQRLPVRIRLDPEPLRKHPLRIGLSMTVVVDVHDRSGPVLAQPGKDVPLATAPDDARDPGTEALIAGTIAANLGTNSGQK